MPIEKMTDLFNMLAEQRKGLSPDEDLSFSHKKISKAMRVLKEEIHKHKHEWAQK